MYSIEIHLLRFIFLITHLKSTTLLLQALQKHAINAVFPPTNHHHVDVDPSTERKMVSTRML